MPDSFSPSAPGVVQDRSRIPPACTVRFAECTCDRAGAVDTLDLHGTGPGRLAKGGR